MNLQEFTENAKRTESIPDSVVINYTMFRELQTSAMQVADCLDLIKKSVFYGKEIDSDRILRNAQGAIKALESLAWRTETNPASVNSTTEVSISPREFHGAIGLFTEAVEVLELVNLAKDTMPTLDVADELGDCFWYIAILADAKGLDIEEQILVAVINKLRERYPDKFDAASAISRDKDAEKKVTEQSVTEGSAEEVAIEDRTEEMTVAKLRDRAAELDIKGRSNLTRKSELIEAINEVEGD